MNTHNTYKVALTACSDPRTEDERDEITALTRLLSEAGMKTQVSAHLFSQARYHETAAADRAAELMAFYKDPAIKVIFDISGGDSANDLLPHLNYPVIAQNPKPFWGYSDLTVMLNALYRETGTANVLYQIRNLLDPANDARRTEFMDALRGSQELFDFDYDFVQGEQMEGTVVGGNIRTFLKLAGTRYLPDLDGKILLLEANSGLEPRMLSYLNQLDQMGIFGQVAGMVLGRFSQLEETLKESDKGMAELITRIVPADLPVIKTDQLGHHPDSKAIVIGGYYRFG